MLDAGRLMASPILTGAQEQESTLDAASISGQAMIKLDYAINTTLMTSYVSTLKGDKVGLIAFSDTVHRYLDPKPGKKQFLAMLEATYALQVYPVEPDFETAFKFLASKQRKRALIILFTDILDRDAAEGSRSLCVDTRPTPSHCLCDVDGFRDYRTRGAEADEFQSCLPAGDRREIAAGETGNVGDSAESGRHYARCPGTPVDDGGGEQVS